MSSAIIELYCLDRKYFDADMKYVWSACLSHTYVICKYLSFFTATFDNNIQQLHDDRPRSSQNSLPVIWQIKFPSCLPVTCYVSCTIKKDKYVQIAPCIVRQLFGSFGIYAKETDAIMNCLSRVVFFWCRRRRHWLWTVLLAADFIIETSYLAYMHVWSLCMSINI